MFFSFPPRGLLDFSTFTTWRGRAPPSLVSSKSRPKVSLKHIFAQLICCRGKWVTKKFYHYCAKLRINLQPKRCERSVRNLKLVEQRKATSSSSAWWRALDMPDVPPSKLPPNVPKEMRLWLSHSISRGYNRVIILLNPTWSLYLETNCVCAAKLF